MAHVLVETNPQKNFRGGLAMVGFQKIGVYYCPQLGLSCSFVEFGHDSTDFFCVGVMYSCEHDACVVTLSVYPHRVSLKNMPVHGGDRTYDLWNTRPMLFQLSYAVRSVRVCDISRLLNYIDIEGTRFCSEISHTRTDLTV